MASQHNENLLMPCAAAAMKLTDCTELLFVLFRSFDMCQCIRMKGRFYLTGVNHFKAHCTQFEDSSGAEARTMKNVAVVTNLRIYHWTIKQSCSAGNGTHWTHVPWCVQSHVKTQLTFWQHPPFCFHLPFSAPVPAYPVCGLCCDLALYLRGSDYHIHIHFIQRCSFFLCVRVCVWREGKCRDTDTQARSDLKMQFSKVRGITVVRWPHGSPACIWDDLPIVHERDCPAPGPGWVCARSQPHHTLSFYLSIFPHCAQRWQLAFSCL